MDSVAAQSPRVQMQRQHRRVPTVGFSTWRPHQKKGALASLPWGHPMPAHWVYLGLGQCPHHHSLPSPHPPPSPPQSSHMHLHPHQASLPASPLVPGSGYSPLATPNVSPLFGNSCKKPCLVGRRVWAPPFSTQQPCEVAGDRLKTTQGYACLSAGLKLGF